MKFFDELPVWIKLKGKDWEEFVVLKLFEEFIEYQQSVVEKEGEAKKKTLVEEASDLLELIDELIGLSDRPVSDFSAYWQERASANGSSSLCCPKPFFRKLTIFAAENCRFFCRKY